MSAIGRNYVAKQQRNCKRAEKKRKRCRNPLQKKKVQSVVTLESKSHNNSDKNSGESNDDKNSGESNDEPQRESFKTAPRKR